MYKARTVQSLKRQTSVLLVLALCTAFQVNASVVIDTTRVIYPETKSEVSVRMTNESEEAKLVQLWIDDGDQKTSPEKLDVPFVVLTPIFRIDPKKGQVARIQYTRSKSLPTDRESVFWFNVLEIPAKPKAQEGQENYLQFRYRTRLKLFLRPQGLEGTAQEAPDKLTFQYKPGFIQIQNPTAFHISIRSFEVGDKGVGGTADAEMIAPRSTKLVELKNAKQPLHNPVIKFQAINDYGGTQPWKKNATAF